MPSGDRQLQHSGEHNRAETGASDAPPTSASAAAGPKDNPQLHEKTRETGCSSCSHQRQRTGLLTFLERKEEPVSDNTLSCSFGSLPVLFSREGSANDVAGGNRPRYHDPESGLELSVSLERPLSTCQRSTSAFSRASVEERHHCYEGPGGESEGERQTTPSRPAASSPPCDSDNLRSLVTASSVASTTRDGTLLHTFPLMGRGDRVESSTSELTSFSAAFFRDGGGDGCSTHGQTEARRSVWAPQFTLVHFRRQSSLSSLDGEPDSACQAHQRRRCPYRQLYGQPVAKPLHLHLAQQQHVAGFNVYGDPISPHVSGEERRWGALRFLRWLYGRPSPVAPSTDGNGPESPPTRRSHLWEEVVHGFAWLLPFGLAVPFAVTVAFVCLVHHTPLRLCGEKCYCTAADSALYVFTAGCFYYLPAAAFTPSLFLLMLAAGQAHEAAGASAKGTSEAANTDTTSLATTTATTMAASVASVASVTSTTSSAASADRGEHTGEESHLGRDTGNASQSRRSCCSAARGVGSGSAPSRRMVSVPQESCRTFASFGTSASEFPTGHTRSSCPRQPSAAAHSDRNSSDKGSRDRRASCAAATAVGEAERGQECGSAARHAQDPAVPITPEEEQCVCAAEGPCHLFSLDVLDRRTYLNAAAKDDGHANSSSHCCRRCCCCRAGACVAHVVDALLPPPVVPLPLASNAPGTGEPLWGLPSAAKTMVHSYAFWAVVVLRYICVTVVDTQLPSAERVPFLLHGLLRACALTLPLFLYAAWLLVPLLCLPCFLIDYFSGFVLLLSSTIRAKGGRASLGLLSLWPLLVFAAEKVLTYAAVGAIKRSSLPVFAPAGSSLCSALKTLVASSFASLSYAMVFVGALLTCMRCGDGGRALGLFLLVFFVAEVAARTMALEQVGLWLYSAFDRHVLQLSSPHSSRSSADQRRIASPTTNTLDQSATAIAGPCSRGDEGDEGDDHHTRSCTASSLRRGRQDDGAHGTDTLSSSSSSLARHVSAVHTRLPVVSLTGTTFASISARTRGPSAFIAAVAAAPVFLWGQWPRVATPPAMEHAILHEADTQAADLLLLLCRGHITGAVESSPALRWLGVACVLAVTVAVELGFVMASHVRDSRWHRVLLGLLHSSGDGPLLTGKARVGAEGPTPVARAPVVRVCFSSAPLVIRDVGLLVGLGWLAAAVGVSTALMAVPV